MAGRSARHACIGPRSLIQTLNPVPSERTEGTGKNDRVTCGLAASSSRACVVSWLSTHQILLIPSLSTSSRVYLPLFEPGFPFASHSSHHRLIIPFALSLGVSLIYYLRLFTQPETLIHFPQWSLATTQPNPLSSSSYSATDPLSGFFSLFYVQRTSYSVHTSFPSDIHHHAFQQHFVRLVTWLFSRC